MRKIYLFLLILGSCINKVSAQITQEQVNDPILGIKPLLIHGSPSSTCSKHIGEQVYIEDTVTGYKLMKECELLFVGWAATSDPFLPNFYKQQHDESRRSIGRLSHTKYFVHESTGHAID